MAVTASVSLVGNAWTQIAASAAFTLQNPYGDLSVLIRSAASQPSADTTTGFVVGPGKPFRTKETGKTYWGRTSQLNSSDSLAFPYETDGA